MSILSRLRNIVGGDDELYPTIEVDQSLYNEVKTNCKELEADNGGPLLLVRPPRENEGMDASVSIYETLHNPREYRVGLGRFSAIRTNAHTHAHEIWFNDGKMQFFYRPQTRVIANKFRRQIKSQYPDTEVRAVDQRFPALSVGEYVSIAEMQLKRDFYYPIKAKLCSDDDFSVDPYGDITSDMVVEEDETSEGKRVEAKDCKMLVQTTFEPARDVWHKDRPYGMDVAKVASDMKQGELHGNMVQGHEIRNPSQLKNKAANVVDSLRGSKAYYINIRIVAISPYAEIARRRCYTVSQDFEKYYNSITQQGLSPVELTPEEMRITLPKVAAREYDIGFRERFMANGKFIQPVEALGALAHIPNDDINTPVVDYAKQATGPGSPAETTQIDEEEREAERRGDDGKRDLTEEITPDDAPTPEATNSGSTPTTPSKATSTQDPAQTTAGATEAKADANSEAPNSQAADPFSNDIGGFDGDSASGENGAGASRDTQSTGREEVSTNEYATDSGADVNTEPAQEAEDEESPSPAFASDNNAEGTSPSNDTEGRR